MENNLVREQKAKQQLLCIEKEFRSTDTKDCVTKFQIKIRNPKLFIKLGLCIDLMC